MLFPWSGAGYPGGEAPDPGDGVQVFYLDFGIFYSDIKTEMECMQDAATRLPRRAHHWPQLLQRQLECLVFIQPFFCPRLGLQVGLILLLPC